MGKNKSNTSRSFVASLFEHKKFILCLFLLLLSSSLFLFFLDTFSIITICLEKEFDGKRNDWQRILYTVSTQGATSIIYALG